MVEFFLRLSSLSMLARLGSLGLDARNHHRFPKPHSIHCSYEAMEVETFLDAERQPDHTVLKTRRLATAPNNRRRTNLVRLGFGCLAIALLAMAVIFGISKIRVWTEQASHTFEKKGDVEDMVFKTMFTTNYLPSNRTHLLHIENIDDISSQLNTKTDARRIQMVNAYFHRDGTWKGIQCDNPLKGRVLILEFTIFSSRGCLGETEDTCKSHLQQELEDALKRLPVIPITVKVNDRPSEAITIKACRVTELTDPQEEVAPAQDTVEKVERPTAMGPKQARIRPIINTGRSSASRNARCALCINKIGLVQLPGEFNTRIEDDIRTDIVSTDDRNQPYLTATVFEDSNYRLHVQLDCDSQLGKDSAGSPCSRSLSVFSWLDYDDDEFDNKESAILRRAWSENDASTGAYDLDVRVPLINDRTVKPGIHRLRLWVMPSEEYQRECGTFNYQEIRDYKVNVVRKVRVTAPPRVYVDPICYTNFAKIMLVLMAGEKGTEIRDDIPKISAMNNHPNRHHLAVTLMEHTIYLMRIQLDCTTQLPTDLTRTGCNLAQDVIVALDLNDDGRFDESEIGSPYRWPVTSYMAEGIYDIQIYVPSISTNYPTSGQHRMRIIVAPSEYYIRTCGFSNYNETREYQLTIIPKTTYAVLAAAAPPPAVITNFECSSDVGRIVLVVMAGEYRTQIRDDPSTRAVINRRDRHEEHLSITLYEGIVYLLRIQLECTRQRGRDWLLTNCTLPHDVSAWIDLDGDGQYEDGENAAPYKWPLTSYVPEGVYDLQIYVPIIDGRRIRTGPHTLRLVVTLNEQYRTKCGNNYYVESREYNVTIVRYSPQPIETGVPDVPLNDNVCSQTNSKIVLVIMTGELGTHIRDDTPMNTLVPANQNRHHLAVTLYSDTIYRIRIQLDCDRPSSKGLYDINCNHAQDVNVWVDFNGDGIYDDSESRVAPRSPFQNSMGLGIYDLNIAIPTIDGQIVKSGTHRVRVVVMPTNEYRRKCGKTDYQEVREYTFNIIPRVMAHGGFLAAVRSAHCSPGNLACSDGHGAIFAVKLYGEQGTQIDDASQQCSSSNNYRDQTNLAATLYDATTYSLRIELFCVQQWAYANSFARDPALFDTVCTRGQYLDVYIDFNDDGIFDEVSERVNAADRYRDDSRRAQHEVRIDIPRTDGRSHLGGSHRMRVVLAQDERNRRPCFSNGYGEARDYTVHIIGK